MWITACFKISAYPDLISLIGNVFKALISIITLLGWKKVPIKFLPYFVFRPFLPPIELSTWESKVVGINIKLTPLKTVLAIKPDRSPTVPPPIAIIVEFLSILYFIRFKIKLE